MTSIHHTLRAAALAAAALFIGLGAQAQTTVNENFDSLTGQRSVPVTPANPAGLANSQYGGTNVLSGGSLPLISWSWNEVGSVVVAGADPDNFLLLNAGDSFTFQFTLAAPVSNIDIGFAYSNTNGNPNNPPVGTATNSWTMDSLSGPLLNTVVANSGNPSSSNNAHDFAMSFNGLSAGSYNFTWARSGTANSGSLRIDDFSATVTAVPEPETYAMMLAGLGAIGFMSRRRKARQA